MLGDIAIPSIVDSEPMYADDHSKVRFYLVLGNSVNHATSCLNSHNLRLCDLNDSYLTKYNVRCFNHDSNLTKCNLMVFNYTELLTSYNVGYFNN